MASATSLGEHIAARPAGGADIEALLARYYAEFRTIACRVLRRNDERLAIRPTDLVHEAALRLLGNDDLQVTDRVHFMALGAKVMRAALIDEVRRRNAIKRGGHVLTVWDHRADNAADTTLDLESFDGALDRLADIEPESARIVELRVYAGLTMGEVARTLAISESTTHRRWRSARAWLFRELQAA